MLSIFEGTRFGQRSREISTIRAPGNGRDSPAGHGFAAPLLTCRRRGHNGRAAAVCFSRRVARGGRPGCGVGTRPGRLARERVRAGDGFDAPAGVRRWHGAVPDAGEWHTRFAAPRPRAGPVDGTSIRSRCCWARARPKGAAVRGAAGVGFRPLAPCPALPSRGASASGPPASDRACRMA